MATLSGPRCISCRAISSSSCGTHTQSATRAAASVASGLAQRCCGGHSVALQYGLSPQTAASHASGTHGRHLPLPMQ